MVGRSPGDAGQPAYFGMKVHVGTDTQGLVHTVTTTDAAQADITQLPQLLHGAETTLYGDKAYWRQADREAWQAEGKRYRVNRRGVRTAHWDAINAARSRVRSRCEHVFRVLKCSWGFVKVRYRGLHKNTTRVYAALALANLYLMRYRLRPQGT